MLSVNKPPGAGAAGKLKVKVGCGGNTDEVYAAFSGAVTATRESHVLVSADSEVRFARVMT